MVDEHRFGEDSAAVQAHLSILQSVIQRMAANSSSCKAWCIALASAILVLVADKDNASYALIAALPTILFFALDTYYLALETGFRHSYNTFITKLHSGGVVSSDLYSVTLDGPFFVDAIRSGLSFSIWPFYTTLGLMIWLTKSVVMKG